MYFNVAFQKGSPQPEFSISKTAIEKYNEKVGVKVGPKFSNSSQMKTSHFPKYLMIATFSFKCLGAIVHPLN